MKGKSKSPRCLISAPETPEPAFSFTFSPLRMIGGFFQPKIEKKTTLSAVQVADL
jgi:hypothetical protein